MKPMQDYERDLLARLVQAGDEGTGVYVLSTLERLVKRGYAIVDETHTARRTVKGERYYWMNPSMHGRRIRAMTENLAKNLNETKP